MHMQLGLRHVASTVIALVLPLAVVPAASSADPFSPADPSRVGFSTTTGKQTFLGTATGRPLDLGLPASASPPERALAALSQHASAFGVAGSASALRVLSQQGTAGGGHAVRLVQTHAGVPVLGGDFVVNLDAQGDLLSVLGAASPGGRFSTTPDITAATATETALGAVAREHSLESSELVAAPAELNVYDPRLLHAPDARQSGRLAWVVDVRAKDPVSEVGDKVIVDAALGTVALSFPITSHALNRTVCDANNVRGAQVPCTSPARVEGGAPSGVADVNKAYDLSGATYAFYLALGRDSIDGHGMPIRSTVRACDTTGSCPMANAFWNGQQMVYGTGYAGADDVVAHELTHGVTEFSSSLMYYMQSGAINESMSDVMGELFDLTSAVGGGNDSAGVRWLLGEDIPGGAIRNMADPTVFNDPDRMLSPHYTGDASEQDAGGVHTNSGVGNKAAFLIADGGTFNGITMGGIGLQKTARLYYTVETSMLTSSTQYADLAGVLVQACTNLAAAGVSGITTTDCSTVSAAVTATEMAQNPDGAPTSRVTECPALVPVYVYQDNLENPHGQFVSESSTGSNAWAYPQNAAPPAGVDLTYATSGVTNIWGYNLPETSDSWIRMATPVAIPAGAFLNFKHAFGFEDAPSAAYDGGVVEYSTAGAAGPWTDAGPLFASGAGAGGYNGTITDTGDTNPLQGRPAFVRESNGYGASRADLASLAGQNVMFRWRIGSDSTVDDYGWFIDDIAINTCADPSVPPPPAPPAPPAPPVGDTTQPKTFIKKHPTKVTHNRKSLFVFRSNESGVTFRCKLNRSKFRKCWPRTLVTTGYGKQELRVKAVDKAGNFDHTPAKYVWRVTRR